MGDASIFEGARAQVTRGASRNDALTTFRTFDPRGLRRSAVLVLFGPRAGREHLSPAATTVNDIDLLLEVRADTLRHHPGEVSFPGGRVDPTDIDVIDTALREAEEETGLDRTGVEVITTMPDLPLLANDFVVSPVVAWRTRAMPLQVMDTAETHEVLLTPVAHLVSPERRFTSVFRHDTGAFRGPAFDLGTATVWGFTALIIDHLIRESGWEQPWPRDDERDIFRLR